MMIQFLKLRNNINIDIIVVFTKKITLIFIKRKKKKNLKINYFLIYIFFKII